ncbi:MAG: hypothetical protein PHN78_00880 [Dehalococcoidales bacterium]|nr:hypothetical protein [Dehalococcoidales bacterium]
MKIGKTTWIAETIGAMVIVLAGLGFVRFQQFQEQVQLNNQLVQSNQQLNGIQLEQLTSRKTNLENQLLGTITQFETSKDIMSKPIETVTIIGDLLDIAAANLVEVTEITSSESFEQLEGINCATRSISAKVSGDMVNLVNFTTALNGRLETGVVKSMTVSIPPATSNQTASATIKLVVYIYVAESYG